MSNKLKYLILFILLAVVSINYADGLRGFVNDISAFVVKRYSDVKEAVTQSINEHFDQRDEIRSLREQNAKLEEKTLILDAYALKLSSMLKEANLSEFKPHTKLVRALSYANFGDYNKVWLDFDGFRADKIYGLIYQGFSAGIITSSGGRPLALLQNDPKSTFSVSIGKDRIKGIAFGADNRLEVRYIPLWTEPKIGEEVITSGLDGIFFEGVKVGKVAEVNKDESYFTVVIEPYANINIPSFFHAAVIE